MDLYLDSADITALRPLLRTGLFAGVTTNPLILRSAGERLRHVPTLVRELVELTDQVFVQAPGTSDVEQIVGQARELRALSDRVTVKVVATRAGLTAARRLADEGVPVLVTAVYGVRQALLAAAAGADWVAPYLGRISESGRDGVAEVARIGAALGASPTRLLVASVRDLPTVEALAVARTDAATIGVDLATASFEDDLVHAAARQFDQAVDELC